MTNKGLVICGQRGRFIAFLGPAIEKVTDNDRKWPEGDDCGN